MKQLQLLSILIATCLTYLTVNVENKKEFQSQEVYPAINDQKIQLKQIKHVTTSNETVIGTAYFIINAYNPSDEYECYSAYQTSKSKIMDFLDSCDSIFKHGDVVSVDGLKWKKTEYDVTMGGETNKYEKTIWEPVANPPAPVWNKEMDSRAEHQQKYFNWINSHPNLNYPPSPLHSCKNI